MRKSTPIAIFVVVLLAAGGSFIWFVEQPGGPSTPVTPGNYNSTQLIILYANALGWDYNSSHPNPTLYEKTHVLLEFKVIEQDNLPHTFTINPGPNESASNAILSVNIPPVTGTITWVNWSFSNTGTFTYWCEVHPESMVGLLVINATTSNTTNASVISSPPSSTVINNYIQCTFCPLLIREVNEEFW